MRKRARYARIEGQQMWHCVAAAGNAKETPELVRKGVNGLQGFNPSAEWVSQQHEHA